MDHKSPDNSEQPVVYFRCVPGNEDLTRPQYMSRAASGMDLPAAIEDTCTLNPQERVLLPTGFAIQLPPGFEAQIRPRSGLALKKGLTVLNSPGTIDNDYRGEIKVILINLDQKPQKIERGERIAQLVICRYTRSRLVAVDELEETERGSGGFGSTDR